MTTIGAHEFSEMDVRKTLQHAIDLLDLYPERVVVQQAERRERISSMLDGVDVAHGSLEQLEPLLARVWPELLSARDDLLAAGAVPPTGRGIIDGLHLSDGGLPKRAVERVEVDFGGVVGDRQATRAHHGRPFQALCLWSGEVIAGLAADGHPIGPGCAGENATIGGLHWPDTHPGVRLRLGTALCEISAYAVPCSQNARWFSDGDFSRIHHDNGSLSRIYATVLEPGIVEVGDAVVLEPEG